MSLNIYTSNRMENLVAALADVVATPLASPFSPEVMVIQSKGMQRWLSMELAKRFGIWANCDYPFPNDMVWRLFRLLFPEIPDRSPFSPAIMTWRVTGILPALLSRDEFGQLRHYLEGEREELKLYQLAVKIADTFDQYTMFRPEMLLEWEAGDGEEWQAVLWRELTRGGKGVHRGRLKEDFCLRMHSGVPHDGFPERIAVFGISYLPKYHLDVLAAAARATEVNLFLLSPTREYWADIASARETAAMPAAQRALRVEGNPLLASLGKLGRDFSDMVIEIGEAAAAQEDLYADPGQASLLCSLQSDILNLVEGGDATALSGDRSIRIHSCHSPMREIEVLHDNLLDLFEREDGLLPRDVVVMTPDIETYAPYIASVFDGCQDPARKIPYSIADRTLSKESMIAAIFLKLLALPGSRLGVPQVLDILESPPVGRRFGLDAAGLETIRRWVKETGIRWGMDEEERLRLGLPGYRENSWQAGIERLLLGYAMSPAEGWIFNDILPCDGVEGSGAVTLGKFLDFIQRIALLKERLANPQTLSVWREILRSLLDDFIPVEDESARETGMVVEVLDDLAELQAGADFTGKVALTVIRSWISSALEKRDKGFGFMTGGVTFCAMLPMRSIPFRVVALVGMNDGVFPRQSRPPGFDLIARRPRRGDRSLRDEDRYLFLESVLSARDLFYLSHVGQSIRDNSTIPPSVLVSEFLDSIRKRAGEKNGEALVTTHRLQAFSTAYFTEGSPLFSYSAENHAALREKRAKQWIPAPFLAAPLPPPPGEGNELPLPTLLRFFANPAKFLLEKRLGIRLEKVADPLEEREPFGLDQLQSYLLNQELLEMELQGKNPAEALPAIRSRGIIPPAMHGEAVFSEAACGVRSFAGKLKKQFCGSQPLAPLEFELELNGFRLTGKLDGIRSDRMIRYRYARMKGKDRFCTWLEHLILNRLDREGYPARTVLVTPDVSRSLRPAEHADILLERILEVFRQGLSEPLRFFPESAMEYAHKLEWNLEKARRSWRGGEHWPGEGEDPYYRKCFGSDDPFTPDFEVLARELLAPMMEHQE